MKFIDHIMTALFIPYLQTQNTQLNLVLLVVVMVVVVVVVVVVILLTLRGGAVVSKLTEESYRAI